MAAAATSPYVAEVEQWRAKREERLKADGGWLTVSGLFWLKDGANTFGSAPGNDIVLPASAPARAGVIDFSGGKATVRVEPGVRDPLRRQAGDGDGAARRYRGRRPRRARPRPALAPGDRARRPLRDPAEGQRRARGAASSPGSQWYPVSEAHRVVARFVPHATPKTIPIANVLGQEDQQPSPGYVVFTIGDQEVRLEPILEAPDAKELFFIFKDPTAGRDTYPAGRYLYTDLPKDGTVTLDFNKAYSPPCAFTAYATCPLPPPQNRLPVRIEAGEKKPAPLH